MNERPHGNELLETARRVLLDQLLPLLPSSKVYDTLMVANAMAIAARELAAAHHNSTSADDMITLFYLAAGLDSPGCDVEPLRDLASQIRMRRIPDTSTPDLHALLLDLTRQRLAISNPKHFELK